MMVNDNFETDEDRMIYALELHRDTIKWFCNKLEEKGIRYKVTKGNSAKGDILLVDPEDAYIVKEMINSLHKENNA